MTPRRPLVLKFGGGSLADPDRVVAAIAAAEADGGPAVVVVSARRGVTDLLRTASIRPGPARASEVVRALLHRHPGLPSEADPILARVDRLVTPGDRSAALPPERADELLSQGERLAAHWLAARLRDADRDAEPVEADRLGLFLEGAPGAGRIDLARSAAPVRAGLDRSLGAGRVPVVTGYFGRGPSGRVTTLGRGGSDYSATAVGAIVAAPSVDLVKRNVPILTADPTLVPSARTVDRLSYDEAEELAQVGGSVLHPAAIDPARRHGVVVRVRSLEDPSAVTTIGVGRGRPELRIIARLGPLGLVRIPLESGSGREAVVARISRSLAAARIRLTAIVTTEAAVGLLVDPAERRRARAVLRPRPASSGSEVGPSRLVSLVTVIGDQVLRDLPRIPSTVLGRSLGLFGTHRSLSLALPDAEAPRGVRALHRALVPSDARGSRRRTDELISPEADAAPPGRRAGSGGDRCGRS